MEPVSAPKVSECVLFALSLVTCARDKLDYTDLLFEADHRLVSGGLSFLVGFAAGHMSPKFAQDLALQAAACEP